MGKPNLFEIATKELSQDAFFTWLLKWADDSNLKEDKDLCTTAKKFVSFLLEETLDEKIDVKTVKAYRQWNNIDIAAEINGTEVFLAIEDKTNTKAHSNQLNRYKELVEEKKEFNHYSYIYLKTGFESESSFKRSAFGDGWEVINRKMLVNFFNNNPVNNLIYKDYSDYINKIEQDANSFENTEISEWSWSAWNGFYEYLEMNLQNNDWDYTSNPSGGFLGFRWNFHTLNDNFKYNIYLQLEQGKLCFKILSGDKSIATSQKWLDFVLKQSHEKYTEIKKTKILRKGTYMTFAIVDRKDWLGDDSAIMDKAKVLEKLKEYGKFLDECVTEYKNQ